MVNKSLKLITLSFILMVVLLACIMRKSIIGKYYHEALGANYILELKSNNIFTQTLVKDKDTFINVGKFSVSGNKISCTFWKDDSELLNTKLNEGGCAGCELKYRNGKLYYYTDPDGNPKDVFVKAH